MWSGILNTIRSLKVIQYVAPYKYSVEGLIEQLSISVREVPITQVKVG